MNLLLLSLSIIIFLNSTLAIIFYNFNLLGAIGIFPKLYTLNFGLIAFFSIKSAFNNLKIIDVISLSLIFYSLLIGLLRFTLIVNESYKFDYIIYDFIAPLFFYIIFLSSRYSDIFASYLKKIIPFLILSSTFTILSSKVISIFSYARQGYVLPLNLPFSFSLSQLLIRKNFDKNFIFNILLILLIALFTFISGKRSVLLSFLLLLLFTILLKSFRNFNFSFLLKKTSIFLFIFIVIFFITLIFGFNQIFENSKTKFLIDFLMENQVDFTDQTQIKLITSGRSSEILSIIPNFKNIYDWLFGLGSGFYYQLDTLSEDYGIIDFKRNIHFSPLSLTYKYGLIFTIVFYLRILNLIFQFYKYSKNIMKSSEIIFNYSLIMYVLLTLMQSFFSFNLFVIPLLPITLSVINSRLSYLKSNLNFQRKLK